MSDLPAGLRPLPLDAAAAAGAIAACQRSAGLVAALADARARAAAEARADWLGDTRDDFDRDALRLDVDAAELIAELARTAAGLATATSEIAAENRRRAAARDDWTRADHEPT